MANKKKTSEMIGHSSFLEMDAWNEEKDGAATLAVAKEFNALLSSMVHAFSNGSRGVNGSSVSGVHGANEDRGDPARASSLTGNYQPLLWSQFIGVETAARRLSKIAFPFTDVCHRLTERVEKGKPGFMRKSFAERHLLWEKPVMVQLKRVQEERKKVANAKIDTAANVNETHCRDVTHPNINDIRCWREVIVAMLKPQTDFGWHNHGGDAAETMQKSLSSNGFEARAGEKGGRGGDNGDESDIVDDAESKTLLQIHDAGKMGVEIDQYNNPPPTCHLDLGSVVGIAVSFGATSPRVDVPNKGTAVEASNTPASAGEGLQGVHTYRVTMQSHPESLPYPDSPDRDEDEHAEIDGGGEEKESRNGVLLQGGQQHRRQR